MGRTIVMLALVMFVGIGAVSLTGCKRMSRKSSTSSSKCDGCAEMTKAGKGWCDDCGKGMVDGKDVACFGCYIEKTKGIACAACAKRE